MILLCVVLKVATYLLNRLDRYLARRWGQDRR